MQYFKSNLYLSEIKNIINNADILQILSNKIIVITGARGLIGSELIDTIMYANINNGLNCKIYGITRNIKASRERFKDYIDNENFILLNADINKDKINIDEDIDYFIQGASNTHPIYYATKPIETILTNTVGTNNVLDFAFSHNCKRFIFLSSVEVYGENKGDIDKFTEDYLGYIDCNTLRAGYPEGKRLGEALCQAYIKEKGIDCVIARISRSYGSGTLDEDSKALSQFISNAVNNEDIMLKSEGNQYYSYIYVADVVSAIIFLLENGKTGEAYNLTGKESDITLKELSKLVASIAGTNVVYDIPDESERKGYSKATKALLDTTKIAELGWHSQYSIKQGIKRTLELKKMGKDNKGLCD
jgi:nucleoside-diphosphate-sugar epimerase